MAIVKLKPTSAGRRAQVKVVNLDLYKGRPVDALIEKQTKNAGRNNYGRVTMRHQGGGHKQHYRLVDFRRNKDGIPAKVERLEYDPNRTANIALLCYADGERRYVLAAKGMVTPDQPRTAIAEEFRVIKRPLLRNATDTGPARITNANLIMVTSAMPGEGKTFSAINLAISMAMELDYTVLLVDADVSRPSVFRQLGLPPERGLMDVLAGDVTDLSDVLLRTNIEKLSILPAGMPHQRATELLASENMNRLLKQIASRYSDRIVVFDSPPLLVTTESRVLATHMGQVVVVVESERTPHSSVKQALATIESCPIKLMMLNKSRHSGPGSYYGYGYGYGYGEKPREAAA